MAEYVGIGGGCQLIKGGDSGSHVLTFVIIRALYMDSLDHVHRDHVLIVMLSNKGKRDPSFSLT